MIHYDSVLKDTIQIVKKIWIDETTAKAYIVQNVYGKISVYIDTDDNDLVKNVKKMLYDRLESWLTDCESLNKNYFAQVARENWEKEYHPVSERIWVIEKFLTNSYWNSSENKRSKHRNLKAELISFYSFKGGVGRTTTMVMAAIELAKRGKQVVMVDFDLEAPGISSLFPEESMSKYGVLDFFLENAVTSDDINIDEYVYTVSDYCHVNQAGGELYVVPAYGQVCKDDEELYRKNLMRFNLDIPEYLEEKTPIDELLMKIDGFLHPDYIFIDTRSGLHQIGGITLARYSDMSVLFFFGSKQNVDGMGMVIPALKKCGTPFTLVNCKIPANEDVALIEKKIYLEGAYNALAMCDDQYRDGLILIDDETAEHYPVDISYSETLEVINNIEQLMKGYNEQKANYKELMDIIQDIKLDTSDDSHSTDKAFDQKEILETFADIMNGLETAAAEDEFSTEASLKENFYPLKGYTFIFDTRKFLVLGQKGIGKTALFSALKNNEYAKSLAKYLKVDSAQYEYTEWIVGTSQDTNWASEFSCLQNDEQVKAFLYYKTIEIMASNDTALKSIVENSNVGELFQSEPDLEMYRKLNSDSVFHFDKLLHKINEYLKEEKRIITIIYDALDRVVETKDRAKFSSALIDMWYRNENGMQNVRSKIFLRKDIYDREVDVADKVKLKNYSVTLSWEYDQLFAMVWKRAICKSAEVKRFYENATNQLITEIAGMSYIPIIDEQGNRDLLAALIGNKMGSEKKALTYNWFKNRLSDTQGTIVPRSMLDIFAKAAARELELRNGNFVSAKNVIRPRCFEESLEAVSYKRVIDLKEEFREYSNFLDRLKTTIQRSPVDEEMLSRALEESELDNPKEEIKNLINIGILRKYQRRLSDPVRYHFPDIYLKGLGLQRAGMH